MNKLNVPFLYLTDIKFEDLDVQLDKLIAQPVDYLLWSDDGYKPQVSFTIAHNGSNIFLRYTVFEDDINVVYNNINDPVYRDTCVEFFISIGNDASYYNLEFNRLGICLAAYGNTNPGRESIPEEEIKQIRSQAKLQKADSDFIYQWQLTLIIPLTVFIKHHDINLNGLACKANFYKCGDDLPKPHFLAWSNIESQNPNFHLPQFFGDVLFATEH